MEERTKERKKKRERKKIEKEKENKVRIVTVNREMAIFGMINNEVIVV